MLLKWITSKTAVEVYYRIYKNVNLLEDNFKGCEFIDHNPLCGEEVEYIISAVANGKGTLAPPTTVHIREKF